MTQHDNIWEMLHAEKAKVRAKIGSGRENYAGERKLTEWLQRELDCEAKYTALMAEAELLVGERRAGGDTGSGKQEPVKKETGVDSWSFLELKKSERGRVARLSFFEQQKKKGKRYTKVESIYYKNSEGAVQGVTFSSYKRNGSWFLNLKSSGFEDAILLCQTGPRSIRAIHLPKTILQKYGHQMSKDHKGMLKFNIRREADKFILDVPQPVGPVDVTPYVDAEELECRRSASV
jgi:hypothetical protein